MCIKSNYTSILYTGSLLFTHDVLYAQSPTLRDLDKGLVITPDLKQDSVLLAQG